MKAVLSVVALGAFAFLLSALLPVLEPSPLKGVAEHYATYGVAENHGANLVTSVVVNYRGFDTLGEIVVLFLSVTGVGFILRRKEGVTLAEPAPASELVSTGAWLLFGPIVVFGAYVFIHGHLTPGGGFQGGAIIASAVLLLLLAQRDRHLPHRLLSWIESLSGFAYALIGLAGLLLTGQFLSNQDGLGLGLGEWGGLLSAGVIPLIYVLIGLKVGSELSTLLELLTHAGEAKGGPR